MIDPDQQPLISDDELLARFIVHSNEVRADGTVTPRLFLPYKRVEISVNRYRDATLAETWTVGVRVAQTRGKSLYGRADILAKNFRIDPLDVVSHPILPENPNQADITGYPPRKEDQMSLAAKLAAAIEGQWIATPDEFLNIEGPA